MMFLPIRTDTMVIALEAYQVEQRLWTYTKPVVGDLMPITGEEDFLFNGWVKEGKFRISKKVKHPENYLPLIIGSIEGTSRDSLVFIKYVLFPSSRMFLVFWSVVALLLALFFIHIHDQFLYGLVALAGGIGNYLITMVNFNRQVEESRKVFTALFNKK